MFITTLQPTLMLIAIYPASGPAAIYRSSLSHLRCNTAGATVGPMHLGKPRFGVVLVIDAIKGLDLFNKNV